MPTPKPERIKTDYWGFDQPGSPKVPLNHECLHLELEEREITLFMSILVEVICKVCGEKVNEYRK